MTADDAVVSRYGLKSCEKWIMGEAQTQTCRPTGAVLGTEIREDQVFTFSGGPAMKGPVINYMKENKCIAGNRSWLYVVFHNSKIIL
jgi:hypothetical protein